MDEITVLVDADNKVARSVLQAKLNRLKERGLMDAGVVLVQNGGMLQGYLGQAELEFGLNVLGKIAQGVGEGEEGDGGRVRVLGENVDIDDADPAVHQTGETDPENGNEGPKQIHVHFPTKPPSPPSPPSPSPSSTASSNDNAELDLTPFVDRTPLSLCETTPMEYAIELFGKMGLKHLMITQEGTGRLVGVCLKKRVLGYVEGLKEGGED